MSALLEALTGVTHVGIDSSPFIYLIEGHPLYLSLVAPLFERIDAGEITAATSTITVAEVTVLPLRLQRHDLREQYVNLLLGNRNLDIISVDVQVAQAAAELRANFGVRLPDAIQVAAAMIAKCEVFITNDRALKQITAVQVLVLTDLLGSSE